MTFVTALALAIAVLVAGPVLAHRLRRRQAEEVVFPAARLVPAAPPLAKKRARLEDRTLLAIRVLAVCALALLGASPLVTCSRLSVERSSGASFALAIVVDDSMSMRVGERDGRSRFQKAQEGARDLLASAHEGDAVAIVLAGAPARVLLAATSDLARVRATLAELEVSDRSTDLEGALGLANSLIAQLPQIDKRIVVLSDRADGNPDAPPLAEGIVLPVWFPLAVENAGETAKTSDCGIASADRAGRRVRVVTACSPGVAAHGREVVLVQNEKFVVRAKAETPGETTLDLPDGDYDRLSARLEGIDAIASDDSAPVLSEGTPGSLAIVADAAEETVATGGATVVEQALSALKLDIAAHPVPLLPDREADLRAFSGIVLEDPSGFTPEQRKSLASFLEHGGSLFLALGRKAASPPLGATFEPILRHSLTWGPSAAKGVETKTVDAVFGESLQSFENLEAKGRITFAPEDARTLTSLAQFSDGQNLIARKTVGRGVVWLTALPFSVSESDLALRPGFLSLLSAFVDEVRMRRSPMRSEAGTTWVWEKIGGLRIEGPHGVLAVTHEGDRSKASPSHLGAYQVTGEKFSETRALSLVAKELDLRPRAVAASTKTTNQGENRSKLDISSHIALFLLGLMLVELLVRFMTRDASRSRPRPVSRQV